MLHYYLSQSKDEQEAKDKIECIKAEVLPFKQYLETSIKALEMPIEAKWEKIDIQQYVKLKPKGHIYKYKPHKTLIIDKYLLNELKSYIFIDELLPKDKRDYDEKFIITYENSEKNESEIKEDYILSNKELLLNNFKNDKDTESIDNKGFIKIDNIGIKNIDNIRKISWNGEDINFKSATEWLKSGTIMIDGKDILIKECKDNMLFLEYDNLSGDNFCKDGFYFKPSIETHHIECDKELKNENGYKFIYTTKEIRDKHVERINHKDFFGENIEFKTKDSKEIIRIDRDKSEGNKLAIINIDIFENKKEIEVIDNWLMEYKMIKLNFKNPIKLMPVNEEKEEEIESPLRYFLDDAVKVTIKNKNKIEYSVRVVDREEFIIELLDKGKHFIPEDECSILCAEPNTYQLKQQKNAINTLIKQPTQEQHKLINLFYERDKIEWKNDTANDDNIKWNILCDDKRDGIDLQRDFIKKALNTEDFAILEGPPGSGKTTVILELITQIIKRGQKILLCGSTHVAIDNVLERLKNKNMIDKFKIFPIRVGLESALSDEVKEYRLGNSKEDEDSLIKKYNVYNDLEGKKDGDISLSFFMELSNLVCGTTLGILQYPLLKLRDDKSNKIITPIFDYLIIDESSKTTFQEFLIPAMYAKRWILVGDTKQLSPFVEGRELKENLLNLPLRDNKSLQKEYQDSCFKLWKVCDFYKKNQYRYKIALGVSKKELGIIESEINKRKKDKIFGIDNLKVGYIKSYDCSLFDNLDKDLIFYDKKLEQESLCCLLASKIPNNFISFNNEEILYKNKEERDKEIEYKVHEIKKFLKERNWASEIAWRLIREFENRTFKDKETNYTKIIDELVPKSHKDKDLIYKKISTIANISMPSILESLIKGVRDRRSKHNSTIRNGFKENDLKSRHTILKYQGRMHSDISKFPREQFYKDTRALNDLNNIDSFRKWDYKKYTNRSFWVDVKGKSQNGKNEKEVKSIVEELKSFIEYAKNNKQPQSETWSVAILSFYRGQIRILEEKLQEFTGLKHKTSNFNKTYDGVQINIKLCSVDRFQGQEADIVFLSMVNTNKIGFLDNPNRLNVGITRAKYQLVIFGDYKYFSNCKNDMLKNFSKSCKKD